MPESPLWFPYCGVAPTPAELLTRWNFDPAVLGVLLVAGLAATRLPRTERSYAWLAVGVLAIAFVSPLCALSSALFSARVVHHVLLVGLAAPLLARAFSHLRRQPPGGALTWTLIHGAVFWLWHSPPAYGAALSNDTLYWLMQATLLGSAVAFWMSLNRVSAPAAVGALLLSMVQMGLLGALITFASQPLFGPHLFSTAPWGLSALEDQQLAGLIMWAPASAIYLLAALVRLGRMLGPDTAAARA